MRLGMKIVFLVLVCVGLLSGCIPGLFGEVMSYKCPDGSIANVDTTTSPPTVTSGNTLYRLVNLQTNGRWTTEGFLEEISYTDQELTFHEVGGLVNFVCTRL